MDGFEIKELNTKGTKRAENTGIKKKKMVSITAGTNKKQIGGCKVCLVSSKVTRNQMTSI